MSVHFVVEAASVAQVVAVAVPAPERRRRRSAVDAFAPVWKNKRETKFYAAYKKVAENNFAIAFLNFSINIFYEYFFKSLIT